MQITKTTFIIVTALLVISLVVIMGLLVSSPKENAYKYMFEYSNNTGSTTYSYLVAEKEFKDGVLKIYVSEKPAVTESDVKHDIQKEFLLPEKPDKVEVYVNGERVE